MLKRWLLLIFAWCLLLAGCGLHMFAAWYAFQPDGSRELFMWPITLFMLLFLLLIAGLTVSWYYRQSRGALLYTAAWVLLAVVMLPAMRLSGRAAWHISRPGFAEMADRLQPLVDAIHKYEQDEGQPPTILQALVPKYLPALPGTGTKAYEYRYYRDMQKPDDRWRLIISTGVGLNFDQFEYRPSQDYPKGESGNVYERIGTWAYLHE